MSIPEQKPQEYSEQYFLDAMKSNQRVVQIYLTSGIKMVGNILESDDYTILMSSKNTEPQLVYKHVISTISPLYEGK